jgi:hypothetical protein
MMRNANAAGLAVLLLAGLVSPWAAACGFHEQTTLLRGVMNWIYPDSLHVATAVWKAQAAGTIPRDGPIGDENVSPEARNRLGYIKAVSLLKKLERALADARSGEAPPNLAVVLLQPMLWSRYETSGDTVRLTAHTSGPEFGDVVVVTERPVIEALVDGHLSTRDALRMGLVKLYGEADARRIALGWLADIGIRPSDGLAQDLAVHDAEHCDGAPVMKAGPDDTRFKCVTNTRAPIL